MSSLNPLSEFFPRLSYTVVLVVCDIIHFTFCSNYFYFDFCHVMKSIFSSVYLLFLPHFHFSVWTLGNFMLVQVTCLRGQNNMLLYTKCWWPYSASRKYTHSGNIHILGASVICKRIFLLSKECIPNCVILGTVTPETGPYTGGERVSSDRNFTGAWFC